MPESPLTDLAVRRQVLLERIKSGQVRDFQKAFSEIQALVRSAFIRLEGPLTKTNKRQLYAFLNHLEKDVMKAYTKQMKLYRADLEEVAGVFATAEAFDITSAVIGNRVFKVPKTSVMVKHAFERPMHHSGETVDDFLTTFADREAKRVKNTIRKGFIQGQTNDDMVRQIIGTRARKYKDGILEQSRRNTQAVVRTTTQHVASSARQDVFEANDIERYQWVSTLDRRTTQICKTLDGKEYELGNGPLPPIHVGCRSTTIALLPKEFEFLSEGRTRSAELGPVEGKETYYDWLKAQGPKFQDQALGPVRGKLFRDGGLSADEFSKLQLDKNFKPLTLDEMRGLEPEAFKKAKL